MTMNQDPVIYEQINHIAVLTINRPKVYNSINKQVVDFLTSYLTKAYEDNAIHVIILTGAGEKAFSAGVDLKALTENPEILQDDEEIAYLLHHREKPMIGAINGFAITGGLELALACDFLLASENAVFSDTHCKVGIMPTWGISQKLPRLIGYGRAKEMSFTGKKIDAQTALEWGLVNHVFPLNTLREEAMKIATQIAENDSNHIQRLKSIMDGGAYIHLNVALNYEREISVKENKKLDFSQMIAKLNSMRKSRS